MKEHFKQNYLYYLMWLAFSGFICFFVFPYITADYINYDSSYQYFLTQHSMKEIFALLPEDYSPPAYAVALKLFTMVFGNSLLVMRVFQLIPIIGMLYLAAFPVRQSFGVKTSVFCAVFMSISALNIDQIPEIRPTYLAMYFFAVVGLYSYRVMFEDKKSDYVIFTVYSIFGMYTHNIAMLGTLAIFVVMLAIMLFRKSFVKFRNIFICGVICAVTYIPWLLVVFKQFGNVQDDFWVGITPTLQRLFSWTFSSPFEYTMQPMVHALLQTIFSLTICLIILRVVRFDKIKGAKRFSDVVDLGADKDGLVKAGYLLSAYVLPIIFVVVFSLLVYPLATPRYFHVFTGFYIIIFSKFLSVCRLRYTPWVLAAVCSLCFCIEVADIHKKCNLEGEKYIHDIEADIGNDAQFLHYHEWAIGTMCYYFPNSVHYVSDDTYTVLQTFDVFTPEIVHLHNPVEVFEYTDEVYVVFCTNMDGYFDVTGEEMLEETFSDYNLESLGVYYNPETFLSRFELYRITV